MAAFFLHPLCCKYQEFAHRRRLKPLNGSMDMEARKQVLQAFAGDVRILVSTDAGGEGLNLQFCHVVVNFDIPWNPMRLEQRIGRVDRIGQGHVVRAMNFVLQDTVEFRVREVLEEKLAVDPARVWRRQDRRRARFCRCRRDLR